MEPRRDEDAHPLPRAGRLDEAVRIPQRRPRLGGAPAQRLPLQPEPARTRDRTIRSTTPTRRSRSPTSTASAAAPCCTPGTSRASILPTSACARWTASPTTGRSTTATLEPYYAENDRMMGVSGPRRRSGLSAARTDDAAAAAGPVGRDAGARTEQARLALVAVRQRDRLRGLRGPRASASTSRTARRAARRAPRRAPTSPTGPPPSAPASNCARAAGCARSPPTSTAWRPASSTTTPTASSSSSRPRW